MKAKAIVAALLAAVFFAFPGAGFAGDWIADTKTGCKVWNPNPTAGEAAAWTGACKDGFADGRGVLKWLRGSQPYEQDEGEWRAGRQAGDGTQSWPGGQYKGQLLDSLPHGSGVLTLGEARYDGRFLNGKPDGMGVLTNASGTFSGLWRDGCFNDGKRRATLGVSSQSCP